MTGNFNADSADATIASQIVRRFIPAEPTDWSATRALRTHWPEYLMESAELALFMMSACLVTAVLEHPASALRQFLPNPFIRRLLTGLAMGLTLLLLVRSKWGKRSGAHMNPAFTLMFFRLGKLKAWDAVFYAASQFAGGLAGVVVSFLLLGDLLSHPSVNFAATQPGATGVIAAFSAELLISFVLALTVLVVSNNPKLSRYTPYFAASLVAAYITFEAPFSGMSMNPARTFGSAFPSQMFHALWIYFIAPPVAMLIAAEIYVRTGSRKSVYCAKFDHASSERCIFRCRYSDIEKG